MKSHYEEDLGDFPTFSAEHIPVESMVGAYRAESTDQWKAASGMNHYDGLRKRRRNGDECAVFMLRVLAQLFLSHRFGRQGETYRG